MDNNFGIPQISLVSNLALFDGKEEAIAAYAEKIKARKYDNIAGIDMKKYAAKTAKIIKF
jgi:hypothetical protein